MNQITKLFIAHLQSRPQTKAALVTLDKAIQKDGGPSFNELAAFYFMNVISDELLDFMRTVDLAEAAHHLRE